LFNKKGKERIKGELALKANLSKKIILFNPWEEKKELGSAKIYTTDGEEKIGWEGKGFFLHWAVWTV